jgi:hypothetical protein
MCIYTYIYMYLLKYLYIHIGQFTETKFGDLLGVLGNPPVMIFNLSGKNLSSDVITKLNCQTVDVPWVCIYVYIYIYIFIYIYIYIYISIHLYV